MENEVKQETDVIQVNAKRTLSLMTLFTAILMSALIALNIYQFILVSELQVKVEKVKISTFLETSDIIIEKYWLERLGKFQNEIGKTLIEANGRLKDAFDLMEEDYEKAGGNKK